MGTRAGSLALGLLLLVVGAVWVGQGLGYIRGSFMTGQKLWLGIGIACALAGLLLMVLAARRRAA